MKHRNFKDTKERNIIFMLRKKKRKANKQTNKQKTKQKEILQKMSYFDLYDNK